MATEKARKKFTFLSTYTILFLPVVHFGGKVTDRGKYSEVEGCCAEKPEAVAEVREKVRLQS